MIHFYHCWVAGPGWREAAEGHLSALETSGYQGDLILGLVGPESRRRDALALFCDRIRVLGWLEAETGWEQVTIKALHAYAQEHDPEEAVLYAHTKGASASGPFVRQWRQVMQDRVVAGWRDCLRILGEGYDAIGCHYLHPAEYPSMRVPEGGYFGGNYWMAKCGYLAGLPLVAENDRWDAEAWIGLNHPKIYDLFEGWPSPQLYASMRRSS